MADPAGRPRVSLVMPYHDQGFGDEPREALDGLPTLAGFARGLAAAGWAPTGVHHFHRAATLHDGAVVHRFVQPPWWVRLFGRAAHRAWPRHGPAYWQPAPGVARAALAGRPLVVHVFGMTVDWQLAHIARACRRAGTALVVHYHGGLPDGDRATRWLRRATLRTAARVLFTHRAQAEPWLAAGVLRADQVGELPETSTFIAPRPRSATGGTSPGPRCLVVGRLHPIKAPLVALDAFERVATARPGARLDVVGRDDGLGDAARARVASSALLAPRVTFHGQQPASAMPGFYARADVLLHPSRREWSSLAVIEAMACGVVPCATDLPALRALTDDGRVGRLVAPDDPVALAQAALGAAASGLDAASAAAQRHFAERLSFPALGRRLSDLYADVLRARGNAPNEAHLDAERGRRTCEGPPATHHPPASWP